MSFTQHHRTATLAGYFDCRAFSNACDTVFAGSFHPIAARHAATSPQGHVSTSDSSRSAIGCQDVHDSRIFRNGGEGVFHSQLTWVYACTTQCHTSSHLHPNNRHFFQSSSRSEQGPRKTIIEPSCVRSPHAHSLALWSTQTHAQIRSCHTS